jgi:hypothetical protein
MSCACEFGTDAPRAVSGTVPRRSAVAEGDGVALDRAGVPLARPWTWSAPAHTAHASGHRCADRDRWRTLAEHLTGLPVTVRPTSTCEAPLARGGGLRSSGRHVQVAMNRAERATSARVGVPRRPMGRCSSGRCPVWGRSARSNCSNVVERRVRCVRRTTSMTPSDDVATPRRVHAGAPTARARAGRRAPRGGVRDG